MLQHFLDCWKTPLNEQTDEELKKHDALRTDIWSGLAKHDDDFSSHNAGRTLEKIRTPDRWSM